MANPTAATSESIKWYQGWNVPYLEICLVSADGYRFRVCANRLANASTVVKDMITAVSLPDTSAPHPALETTTPIELDYPARVVGAFLRKAYGMRAPQTRDSLFANDKYFDDYNEGIQLYNLLRQLDCPRLLEETYYEVAYAAKREGKSAELLLLASNNADVDLAVKTMERVEDEELDALYTSADDMNQFLVKLRPSWADFLRARVFQTTQDGRQQLRPRTEHRWYLLASDFKYDVGVAEGRYAPRARGGLFSFAAAAAAAAPAPANTTNATSGAPQPPTAPPVNTAADTTTVNNATPTLGAGLFGSVPPNTSAFGNSQQSTSGPVQRFGAFSTGPAPTSNALVIHSPASVASNMSNNPQTVPGSTAATWGSGFQISQTTTTTTTATWATPSAGQNGVHNAFQPSAFGPAGFASSLNAFGTAQQPSAAFWSAANANPTQPGNPPASFGYVAAAWGQFGSST